MYTGKSEVKKNPQEFCNNLKYFPFTKEAHVTGYVM